MSVDLRTGRTRLHRSLVIGLVIGLRRLHAADTRQRMGAIVATRQCDRACQHTPALQQSRTLPLPRYRVVDHHFVHGPSDLCREKIERYVDPEVTTPATAMLARGDPRPAVRALAPRWWVASMKMVYEPQPNDPAGVS